MANKNNNRFKKGLGITETKSDKATLHLPSSEDSLPLMDLSDPAPLRPAKSRYVESFVVPLDSPVLADVWDQVNRDKAIFDLYLERQDHGPLIEKTADERLLITFLYLGDEETVGVSIEGGPSPYPQTLLRFGGSDVWFVTLPAPSDGRFCYSFWELKWEERDGKQVLVRVVDLADELNPHFTTSGSSMLVLPRAGRSYDQIRKHIFRESLQLRTIDSPSLGGTRTYSLYTPAVVSPSGILICLDGEAFAHGWPSLDTASFVPTPQILDLLTASHDIPPLAAAFVNVEGRRYSDLAGNEAYATFLAEELLPAIVLELGLGEVDSSRVIVAGASLGGFCAAFCAYQHPQVFGNVLAMSGSFWIGRAYDVSWTSLVSEGLIQNFYLGCPKLPVRFYLDVGSFEDQGHMVMPSRQLRDILLAKGYDAQYREHPGNHDYMCWHDSVSQGLMALTQGWE